MSPAFSSGVLVDAAWRPLAVHGRPAHGNLHACGAVVARHPDPGAAVLDPGVSAWSGWRAAGAIAKHALEA